MIILGIDEAGRGPLSGPVVAAGVILDQDKIIDGLADSKKLTEKKRQSLYQQIITHAKAYTIVEINPQQIDELNILQATLKAMHQVANNLERQFDKVLVDGNKLPNWDYNSEAIVKGDSKIIEISAASILAKVHRDNICLEHDRLYPQYGFAKHKGYPTKEHLENIKKYGVLDIHRKSYKPVQVLLNE
ncbi:ribonuclease HII [Francisella tularensis]|uniref:Ribonuclease HII n=1 Tax=Francisella tularensis subsp. mediasiatica (strain FSC147) TaxID=441952 RepID=RNH2_FRATM|nr:ribonuclease HII [Francisella tularensis]B2SGW7.1 RecName: Full=Ribonuclease HII; Short=RNase HII [Francisella tularensis subsp. mediasiatica FSC147]ACD30975.1 ribonuclease HII [Francisella tularensis subsp. mediasiatica FSC147]MBK2077326.1 ribonuclease HII [Francisella tularensis subsp. mediasiatica]MBK2101899.1 ribonuclease HII [Francisella tularensis subsp. mediasiatica]MBK2105123.1 ribonuclease HII [Francisella tularensis subsp. mediasiatica]MDN9003406.1 ribonuclease HII [Francisella t